MTRSLGGSSGGFTMVDMLVVLVVLVVLCAITLRAGEATSEADKRVECARNLHAIGEALHKYAKDDEGPYPRCKYNSDKADSPRCYAMADQSNPFAKSNTVVNDVSGCMYLLVREKYITADKFVCPATSQTAMVFPDGKTAADYSDFKDNSVLSYSYSDPYPTMKTVGTGFRMVMGIGARYPHFAMVADMNPGGDAWKSLKSTSSPEELRKGNSGNHGQGGQNILYEDGHIEFQPTPFAGEQGDNIYTYGQSGKNGGGDGIVGSPQHTTDNVLLPTADDGKPAKQD